MFIIWILSSYHFKQTTIQLSVGILYIIVGSRCVVVLGRPQQKNNECIFYVCAFDMQVDVFENC